MAYLAGEDAKNNVPIPLPLSFSTAFNKEVFCDIDIDIDFGDIQFSTLEMDMESISDCE